ncbi:MAG: glycosyltransferase family 4 protein [Candidatus Altiarchaeota archaeon]
MSLRLAYVCQYFTREYGGPVTNLMHELSKSVDVVNYSYVGKHMQYYKGGRHEKTVERVDDRLTLKRYEAWLRLSGLIVPSGLGGMLAEDRPDVVQSEEYYQPASRIAFRYAKKNRVPFIFNHRLSEARTRTLRDRAFFAFANPYCRDLVKGADAVVCLSEAGKKVLCDVYPEAADKVRIIPNSIDPSRYSGGEGIGFRQENNIPEDAPLLLAVARLHPQKRIDLLVKAFAEVKHRNRDAVLCVVGPWFVEEKRKVDSLVRELRVEDVLFTGPIPNQRVKDAYAACDVVGFTSEYEPFGYSLLEAMACAKPVVAFGIGAVSEIVEDSITGHIVPFADVKGFAEKAGGLCCDRQLAKRMGDAGFARVCDKFNLRLNSERLVRIYGEVA